MANTKTQNTTSASTQNPADVQMEAPKTSNGQHTSNQIRTYNGNGHQASSRSLTRSQPGQMFQRDLFYRDPFTAIQRLSNEMDELFGSFGLASGMQSGRREGNGANQMNAPMQRWQQTIWSPTVEMEERDGNLIVKTDLPGLTKEDVHISVDDNLLIIRGERKHNREEKREGFYHSERSYGTFQRRFELPRGVKTENVKASFRDGVLEVTIPMPQKQEESGQRIQIED